ncbi:AAA family ATPase [Serpentinicella sp. ANB-PHB4]|uniref:ATP-binding protein n=1 Tax=Serpentinicella sp. ANB-PHB4 TaxID=3074076 RepID=UPI002863AFF9|nr:AAA family ATPase [Serpentinicella sp. ANB-PHB4]MDR5658523.1 AAA family ATPase [Serpentinicella sp. ANB-PHB4]
MMIKSFESERFAGLKDKKVSFDEGINIVFGPNEAGKSTLVEAIYATLVKQVKLKSNNKQDKTFKKRFMPYPHGDFINGKIYIDIEDKRYGIEKYWGSKTSLQLELPDGQIICDDAKALASISEITRFAEGTFDNILFAKQQHIKEAIKTILEDSDTTETLSSILRKVVMELDGVPIEKLKKKIEDTCQEYLKRWDIENQSPENNRGIHNPYKTDVGEILKAYYEKEEIRQDIKKVESLEEERSDIAKKLTAEELEIEKLEKRIEDMSKIEGEVLKRGMIEPKKQVLENKLQTLKEISTEWPKEEIRIEQYNSDIEQIQNEITTLEEEQKIAKAFEQKLALEMLIKKIEEKQERKNELQQKLDELPLVKQEDITELEENKAELDRIKTTMEAGKIIGSVINVKDQDHDLWVTTDLGERERLIKNSTFKANGYVRVELGELLELELKTGEQDFTTLREKYVDLQKLNNNKLSKLQVDSLLDAKLNFKSISNLQQEMKLLDSQIKELLGDETIEGLKEQRQSYESLKAPREMNVIEEEKKNLHDKEIDLKIKKQSTDAKLKKWISDYEETDKLLDEMIDVKVALKSIVNQLDKLAKLPEEFESAEAFNKVLTELRQALKEKSMLCNDLKESLIEIGKDMPEYSSEELISIFKEKESRFKKALKKGKSLLKIREAFYKNLEEVDSESFVPLTKLFSEYLSELTLGQYKSGKIDDQFNIEIINKNDSDMPIHLLSMGTHDSVALALRLSVVAFLYRDQSGVLVLDDCLIDMDEERRNAAVQLIKRFSTKHQVIFTTCSKETAELLDGHIINM